jgi:6-phosphogluconolactonase
MRPLICITILAGSFFCRPDSSCSAGELSCGPLASALFLRLDRYYLYLPVGTSTELYSLDAGTGRITAVPGSSFGATNLMSVDSAGRFLYNNIQAAAPNNVSSYSIDTYSGRVSATSSPLASANNQPVYSAVHPGGRFIYFSNYQSLDVTAFSIDQATGNLTRIGDYSASCGCTNLAQIQVTPDGKYLYTTSNGGGNSISGFSINQSTGELSFLAATGGVAGLDALLIDPSSSFLYAVSSGGTILGYSINAAGGLSALAGSPFAGIANNFRGAMHPSGKYLYTVNVGGGQLSKHDIGATGTLSSPTTLAVGTNLQFVTLEPNGGFGYINDGVASSIYIFSIDQTGTAALLTGNPFTVSAIPGRPTAVRTNGWL